MSDGWAKWYREDGAPGAQNMSDAATRDITARVPAPPGGAGSAGGAGPAWPSQPPARSVPGGPGGSGWPPPGSGTRGRRRRLRPKRILLALLTLIVLIVVFAVIMYFVVNGKLTRVSALADYSGRPAPSAGTNWLITGSDSRAGLTRTQENQLTLGHDVTGHRSDTIMVLHMPANGSRPVLVSIPRDSYVPIPGHGMNKINSAYAFGGPTLLAKTVQNVTGLFISHYLSIGVGGLAGVVNDIGGVRMCLPAPMNDPKAGLHLKKGCQNLNGAQALAFTRTRNFGEGDLQRVQDQRLLLSAVLQKLMSTSTIINPFASIPAATGAAGALTVDSGTQLYQLISVGFAMRDPISTSVPLRPDPFESTSVGSVVRWDRERALAFFADLKADKTPPKDLITGTKIVGTS